MILEWTDEQLDEAGIDKVELAKLMHDLGSVARRLKKMNMAIYVHSNAASIHLTSMPPHTGGGECHQENMIATQQGPFDGGDW